MKKFYIAIALAGALSATTTQAAYDGVIAMTYGSAHTGSGGEFRVNVISGLAGLVLDSTTVNGYGGFETFCIEKNEYIQVGTTASVGPPLPATTKLYDANKNSGAILGGIAGGTPDPISVGTAWLYSTFRNNPGSLGYLNNSYDAGILQQTFWFLEQEQGTPSDLKFLSQVYSIFTDETGAKANAAPGLYGVVALNLYNGPSSIYNATYGNVNQSQLALVPEPSTVIAGALLLLPFGASTIRFLRKNRTA